MEMTFPVHVIKEESMAGGPGLFISAHWGQTGQRRVAGLIISISSGERTRTPPAGQETLPTLSV